MRKSQPGPETETQEPVQFARVAPFLVCAVLLLVVAAIFSKRVSQSKIAPITNAPVASASSSAPITKQKPRSYLPAQQQQTLTPQEIVSAKLATFVGLRRDLFYRMAEQKKLTVPPVLDRFFETLATGDWETVKAEYAALQAARTNQTDSLGEFRSIWRPLTEAYGAAEQVHSWPAQALLDYGNSILSSLKPGMIYAGGTDSGCFIPTMLNETGEGAQHVIITQNALADSSYLDYVRFRYGDQLNALSSEDSQKGFQDYLADAQKRLLHDQNSPNEPKQIKPGEDIQKSDNRLQVSGQVAVMGINEKLFQTLMAKNPDASFAMEESFPLESVQKNATPLGPIMEIGPKGQTENFTQARAQQSVEQWRGITDQLLADPTITPDSTARTAYAKLLSSQAGLLEQHSFFSEADQDFKFALALSPGNTESVFRYVNLLLRQERTAEAIPVVERAIQTDPANAQFSSLLRQVKTLVR